MVFGQIRLAAFAFTKSGRCLTALFLTSLFFTLYYDTSFKQHVGNGGALLGQKAILTGVDQDPISIYGTALAHLIPKSDDKYRSLLVIGPYNAVSRLQNGIIRVPLRVHVAGKRLLGERFGCPTLIGKLLHESVIFPFRRRLSAVLTPEQQTAKTKTETNASAKTDQASPVGKEQFLHRVSFYFPNIVAGESAPIAAPLPHGDILLCGIGVIFRFLTVTRTMTILA